MELIMVSEQTLAEVTKRLVNNFHPYKIILFGSQARGTADDRSDIDLLVISAVKGDRFALILDMYDSLQGMNLAKDIIVLTPDEFERDRQIPGTVARPAWMEGKILYEQPQ
jgi:predicted nucleotidyltransferase